MKPKSVDPVDVAFGSINGLLPGWESIPKEFKEGRSEWCKWQRQWFFHGLDKRPTPKDGINLNDAMNHLACIQRSFEPKHEHKEAAVAYLASIWFKPQEETPL